MLQRSNRPEPPDPDTALEQMVAHYRAELLRYQRATAPGKPTLAQSLREMTEARTASQPSEPIIPAAPEPAAQVSPVPPLETAAPESSCSEPDQGEPSRQSEAGPAPEEAPEGEPESAPPACGQGSSDAGPDPPAPPGPACDRRRVEEMRATLARSLADISDARVLRIGCCGCAKPPSAAVAAQVLPPAAVPSEKPSSVRLVGCHSEYERGIGAYGVFCAYEPADPLAQLPFLERPGQQMEVLTRFAADLPEGAADASRCRRSFSVRFFCREESFLLPGQHLPVAVGRSQSASQGCSVSLRADPCTGLRSRARFWDYIRQNPCALHAAVWLYSDLGTVRSYRALDGFCCPLLWTDRLGRRHLARCRWQSRQQIPLLSRFEAEELCGSDPDAVAREFVCALSRGETARYELLVQLVDPDGDLPFDPFDPTLIWPEESIPLRRAGLMTLNRLPGQILPELSAGRFAPQHLEEPSCALPAGRDPALLAASATLRRLDEQQRRRLTDNLCDDLRLLPAELLGSILMLFAQADPCFGQSLAAAFNG